MVQSFLRALFTYNLSAILFSTSPPMIGITMSLLRMFRSVPMAYWAMDLNPDQLIALGKIGPRSPVARLLEGINRTILRSSTLVIALDRFMAARLRARAELRNKMVVIPPWPHETFVESVDHATNPFRSRHNLAGKFVVMYSGNHSPSNPLDTLLQAALRLRDDNALRFLFVGGGVGKKDVEKFASKHQLSNVLCLPYQPLADLRYSLSAADVHVVSLGDNMVGIIHPCKVYGAMAVGRPVLFFGPKPSHISDLLGRHGIGWHVAHGDVDGAVRTIQEIQQTAPERLNEMGRKAQEVLATSLSQDILCNRFCDGIELVMRA
jgi:glycosyltransferase involved in cell wall biosynthesis